VNKGFAENVLSQLIFQDGVDSETTKTVADLGYLCPLPERVAQKVLKDHHSQIPVGASSTPMFAMCQGSDGIKWIGTRATHSNLTSSLHLQHMTVRTRGQHSSASTSTDFEDVHEGRQLHHSHPLPNFFTHSHKTCAHRQDFKNSAEESLGWEAPIEEDNIHMDVKVVVLKWKGGGKGSQRF
jgi:hypothetical protein